STLGGGFDPIKLIDRFAYRIFGRYFKKRENRYAGLRKKINQARMEVGYDMYLSRITLLSIITGVLGALIGLLLTWVMASLGVFSSVTLSITLPSGVAGIIEQYKLFIAGFLLTLVFASLLGGITGGILYYVPSFKAGERRRKIDATLPHAVTFMYALSRGGMNIIEVMENLADAQDVYGEVAKEFDMILRDTE
ncbi:MAG: secretion system protein, partial [Halobacteria archaeon]|nr:secretion system protein [Halobacteria archaeon]